ncbi:MAG: hypothetical protein BEN19_01380 [Epulopiscium sp. Nuni2H_MBin003]|nr:MAG: hypothetical protein BEN19_01380 [Epulopiscium sp. Nuni2H_MBin003]
MKLNAKMKKAMVMSVLVTIFSVGCSSGGDAADKNITLRIGAGHVLENITWTMAMEEHFVTEVDARASELGYNITWIKSYGGSVAKLGECLEAVESGILDITYVNFGFESFALAPHNMDFRIPFTCPDSNIVSKATLALFEAYPEEMSEVFEKNHNQTVLGVGVTDNYVIYSKKPINSMDDFKGLSVGGGAGYMYWLNNAGAIPVTANLNEAYTSLQTGVFDANIGPLGASYGVKLHEVAPYVIMTDFGAKMAGALTINNDTLENLPQDLRDVIIEVGAGYSEYEAKLTQDKYLKDIESLKEEGAEFIVFSDQAKQEWVNLIPDVAQELVDELEAAGFDGKDMLDAYWGALSDNGYDMTVNWKFR